MVNFAFGFLARGMWRATAPRRLAAKKKGVGNEIYLGLYALTPFFFEAEATANPGTARPLGAPKSKSIFYLLSTEEFIELNSFKNKPRK